MKKLQDFHFLKSRYERPTQKKRCGWSEYGRACQMGPDADGTCQGRYECIPSRKDDRWHCTRSAENGGKCASGPGPDGSCCNRIPPCVPRDSLRVRRGGASYWLAAFALLALLAVVSGPWWSGFLDPGELSAAHQLDGLACAGCHTDDRDLLSRALAAEAPRHANAPCVDCHAIAGHSETPHNLPPARLEQLRSAGLQRVAEGTSAGHGPDALACHSCHREHRGADAELRQMNNGQCESCHVSRHPDFASQHPAFSVGYPYQRSTRLVFDHARHLNKHFDKAKPDGKAPTGCNDCHRPGEDKRHMTVLAFKDSCASCHAKDVTGERLADKAVPLLGLPALDLNSLQEHGIAIGSWPGGMEDQELPLATRFLLSGDAQLSDLLARLSDPDNPLLLYDLSEADPATLAQVGRLAWRIKALLASLQGPQPVRSAVETLLGRPLDDEMAAALTHQLPPTLLQQTVRDWFPTLRDELRLWQAGQPPATRALSVEQHADDDEPLPGHWQRRPFALGYRPGGHADPLLRQWLDLAARQQQKPAGERLLASLAYPKLSGQCGKCHSVESTDGTTRVNWQPAGNGLRASGLNRFDHGPHLDSSKRDVCRDCHSLDAKADYLAGFEDRDPRTFASNFQPLGKAVCADCHDKPGSGEPCLACHQYHALPVTSSKQKALP